MQRSSTARIFRDSQGLKYNDLTVSSFAYHDFDGEYSGDLAKSFLQLEELLFGNAKEESNSVPAKPKTKAQQRVPQDRQVARPLQDQAREWAEFTPHIRILGNQIASTKPRESGVVKIRTAPLLGSRKGVARSHQVSHAHHLHPQCDMRHMGSEGEQGSSLLVCGQAARMSPAPPNEPGPPLAEPEEVLAAHGSCDEVFACQSESRETHVVHGNAKKVTRDDRALQVGLPPMSPDRSMQEQLLDMAFQTLWRAVSEALAPAVEKRQLQRAAARAAQQRSVTPPPRACASHPSLSPEAAKLIQPTPFQQSLAATSTLPNSQTAISLPPPCTPPSARRTALFSDATSPVFTSPTTHSDTSLSPDSQPRRAMRQSHPTLGTALLLPTAAPAAAHRASDPRPLLLPLSSDNYRAPRAPVTAVQQVLLGRASEGSRAAGAGEEEEHSSHHFSLFKDMVSNSQQFLPSIVDKPPKPPFAMFAHPSIYHNPEPMAAYAKAAAPHANAAGPPLSHIHKALGKAPNVTRTAHTSDDGLRANGSRRTPEAPTRKARGVPLHDRRQSHASKRQGSGAEGGERVGVEDLRLHLPMIGRSPKR